MWRLDACAHSHRECYWSWDRAGKERCRENTSASRAATILPRDRQPSECTRGARVLAGHIRVASANGIMAKNGAEERSRIFRKQNQRFQRSALLRADVGGIQIGRLRFLECVAIFGRIRHVVVFVQTRSIAIETPWPTPTHMVASTRWPFMFSI